MANTNTRTRAETYTMLTDAQKNILKRYFDGGMVGTGQQFQEMITRAAEETEVAKKRVEVSLSNAFFFK